MKSSQVCDTAIQREIADRTEELVGLLGGLIAIPSPPGHEDEVLDHAEDLLRSLGLATSWIQLEQTGLDRHPACNPHGTHRGRNLLAVWGAPKAEPRRYPVLFNGHVDVVPPGEASNWSSPPYQSLQKEGHIFGNGAADMKGGIACLLYVFRLLIDQGFKPAKPIAVELVVDEERLGNGTLANVLAGVSAEQAIFLEPMGSDCIVTGHRGSIAFRITVRGEGTEWNTRGAALPVVSRLVHIIKALEQWGVKRRRDSARLLGKKLNDRAPVYFGTIAGGHWFSAPLVEIRIDGVCGYLPGERREDVEAAFHQHFSSMAELAPLVASGELTVSLDRGFVEPSTTPVDSPLVSSLQRSITTVLGREPRIDRCINGGCDMRSRRIYDHQCQCVLWGPGGSHIHQSDERVSVEELVKVSQVLAEWIIRRG